MGILVARIFELELRVASFALFISCLLIGWRHARIIGSIAALAALGSTLYLVRYARTPDDLRNFLTGAPELVAIRGHIIESPEIRQFSGGSDEIAYTYSTIEIRELQRSKEAWRPATGRVAARLRGELTQEFFKGRMVEVAGVMAYPNTAAAPGLFDYRAHLYNNRIYYQLKSDSTNDWRLLTFEPMPATERFRLWAEKQLKRNLPERDEASEMIAAMTLGLRNSLSNEMSDVFVKTGTMHILAISGLHVACIAYFFSRLLRFTGMPRALEGIVIIGIVWFYTIATGLQSSACRSALMATIFMMVRIVRRPTELPNTVAGSAAIILLVQPEQLFQISFQLSFSVVGIIALIATYQERYFPNLRVDVAHRIVRIDPLLPYELVPRYKKVLKWCFGFVIANFLVSFASWIGSVPLTAFYFNMVTPVSLLANLLAVPLSSVSLGASVVSIMLPFTAPVSNLVAWLFMKWTIDVAQFFSAFSFGYFYVPSPTPVFILAYCGAIAIAFIPQLRKRQWISPIVVALLSLLWLGSTYLGRPIAKITVLPCAGTPTFIQESGGNNLLIDCSSARDAEHMVKRYLRSEGKRNIDQLLITHGDAQAVGGFKMIWNEFSPTMVLTSPARMRSPGYRQAIQYLSEHPAKWKRIAAGDHVDGWEVLHPTGNERGFPRADDNAVVLRKRIGGWTILHISDLGMSGQRQLLERGMNLQADIIIAGMPENGEPLEDELLEAISPKMIILGTTEYPHTSQGSAALRDRLRDSAPPTVFLNESQAVTLTVTGSECVLSSMQGRPIRLSRKAKEAE
ncbi:MAG TPA: ComEC/Rec2 family competence protein [Candidatus Kapabacteria bacterium]|nr:ComEC/Rec2 family competence protein [Candidatus Kapabacteria bacterium]